MSRDPNAPGYSFDEYKLYYDSTEKVTDRRLTTNSWNYGICTAIVIAVATLANWSVSRPEFSLITIIAILMLSGMGMLLCTLWIGQIRDFKALNNAKFDVLNAMAPLVRFGPDDERSSATPFAREWEILQAKRSISEVETMKILALRSSNTEFLVPMAFRLLFGLILIATVIVTAINLPSLTGNIFTIKHPVSSAPPAVGPASTK